MYEHETDLTTRPSAARITTARNALFVTADVK
jgi:hypothetical protein